VLLAGSNEELEDRSNPRALRDSNPQPPDPKSQLSRIAQTVGAPRKRDQHDDKVPESIRERIGESLRKTRKNSAQVHLQTGGKDSPDRS